MRWRWGVAIIAAILLAVYLLQGPFGHDFGEEEAECRSLLGWFTKEDVMTTYNDGSNTTEGNGLDTAKLQPGDILVTLSTHSLGWRHGHAALVIDRETTLECAVLGKDSSCCDIDCWKKYSDYWVLRVKGAGAQVRQQVADYGVAELTGVPYHLSAGFVGPKAPETGEWYYGMQCAYLVWYAWKHFGYDLDSDGGRLVTVRDLLESDQVEVIFSYGMDS